MNIIPKISIAIPAYKDKYLREAITSVLNQSFEDFELIIVNDASPNPITKVVEEFKDSRIRYYINEQNIGGKDPVANWNKCLSYAQGEYFVLLCDDDLLEPTFLERMLGLVKMHPECNVFKSGVKVINERQEVISTYPLSPAWESCADYIHHVSIRKRKQTISEWMFRRHHMISCGGYEPVPMAWGADYLSIMKFSIDGGIASAKEELVTFRRSGENISTVYDKNLEKKLLGTKVYTQKLNDLVNTESSLSAPSLNDDVERIRVFELKAAMAVASPQKIWSIRKLMPEVGVPSKMWIMAIIKNIIKKLR